MFGGGWRRLLTGRGTESDCGTVGILHFSRIGIRSNLVLPIDDSTTAARREFQMTNDKLPDSAEADRVLRQRVKHCLDQRGYAPLRALEIGVERGVVVVQGRVETFYLRQIAIECIKRVASVTQLVDRIKVAYVPDQCQPSADVDDEQDPSNVSIRRMDLRDMAQSPRDVLHTHVLDGDLIRTACERVDAANVLLAAHR